MDEVLTRGAEAIALGQRSSINLAHHRFLRVIATMARQATLDEVLAPLHHRTLLAFATIAVRVHPSGWEAHQAIRDAIAARDALGAEDLMRDHLRGMLSALRVPGNLAAVPVTGDYGALEGAGLR